MPTYVSPRAKVRTVAVLPLIAPPAAVPKNGIHLSRLETMVFPAIVATVEPKSEETIAVIVDFLISIPYIAVMAAIIDISVGSTF